MPSKFEEVQKLIAEQLGVEPAEITLDSTLMSLGADSLEAQALLLELEDLLDTELMQAGMGTPLREILQQAEVVEPGRCIQ